MTCRIHNFTSEGAHLPWSIHEYDRITAQFDVPVDVEIQPVLVSEENLFTEIHEPGSDDESLLSDESDMDESIESTYGLRKRCVFNSLNSFHCISSMPPDCLHDLFEGVLAQDLLGIIRIFEEKTWFSIKEYNKVLKMFPLSPQESSNKPQEVPSSSSVKKLQGKAVSIWCHMRLFLPLISQNGWIVDPNDDVLKLAILLSDITLRVTAEEFKLYEIDTLEELIIQFLDQREYIFSLFPILGSPKPKHHLLSHYADNIRQFGPPMCFWTGRFESKHRVSKSLAESGKNFINISLTLTNRQQYRMASTYFHGMFSEDIALPVTVRTRSELSEDGVEGRLRLTLNAEDIVCNEVSWRSRKYKIGMIVVIARSDQIEMEIGEIKSIIIRKKKVFLLLRKFRVQKSYLMFFKCVEMYDSLSLFSIQDLIDTYPLVRRGSDNNFYVVLHHHISFSYD